MVIPVDLSNKETAKAKIASYYRQNMGSGFDLTPYDDPVSLLDWLNSLSVEETATGTYDRYIGNMGNLHVSHSQIRNFIEIKKNKHIPHFNISVDVDDKFMSAATEKRPYTLHDGTQINANDLLWSMAECAWTNGDPGIISLERMNRDNPVADIYPYVSTPPCSEMGLSIGETCQFGYINIAGFIKTDHQNIDWLQLEDAVRVLTRALDNAIEVSLENYPDILSKALAKYKRKIGLGLCGVADALIMLEIPYDSNPARDLVRNVVSFINYISKETSVELAKVRGSCHAMQTKKGNKYYDTYLETRYGKGTEIVSSEQWLKLARTIKETGLLRNILTTALPPTGRASILMDVTSSLEPIFSASKWNETTKLAIQSFVKKRVGLN